jgi:hypothetical protein
MRLAVLLLCLFLTSCAHIDPWTKEQKVMAGVYSALHVIDWMQTNDIYNRRDENYWEINPVVDWAHDQAGDLGVATYFAGSLAVTMGIAHILPSKYRTVWLTASNVVKIGCVGNNLSIGLNLSLP